MARSPDTLHLAHELYGDMRAAGIRPDAVVFNVLLAAHVRFRGVASSLDVVARMRDAGVMPTVHTFTILVWMYVRERRCGRLAHAPVVVIASSSTTMAVPTLAMADDAGAAGAGSSSTLDDDDDDDPDHHIRSFSALARAYARKGDTPTLRRLLAEIAYQGVVPDATLFYHLLVASAAQGLGGGGGGESSTPAPAPAAAAAAAAAGAHKHTAAMTAAVVAEMRTRGFRLDSRCRAVLADAGLHVVGMGDIAAGGGGGIVGLRDRDGKIWPCGG
ncbi:hypothetical protein BDZ88DRAFT_428331 [Geranomyces variabilis]|nr:hypothetical protein BDZ88DRAFT_428331 [Geranomyces variabilis]